MKVLLTLDYELFLGQGTGSVENCLIKPMSMFLQKVDPVNAKFSLFVDAAYLYMLNKLREKHEYLQHDYDTVCQHLQELHEVGHDIQLHIHPQWYFSDYNGKEWNLDSTHYKLCDVDEKQMEEYFVESKELLDRIVGKKTIAFRAGGFSAQPTELLNKLFDASGVKVDSSVCPGTSYDSSCQKYDYIDVSSKDLYMFSNNICKEDILGKYIELPISMINVSPVFHWKLAFTKMAVKLGVGKQFHRMGDGLSVKTTGNSIVKRLTRTVQTMATIDEYKASLLKLAYRKAQERGNNYFCVLGHPKLATPYSIKKLGEFCSYVKMNGGEFVTLSEIV